MKRVVIIGGGVTGLAAAHRLLEHAHDSGKRIDVKILEAGNQVGGIVQTREREGFLLEAGPDSFISEKPAALELAKRLGLGPHLIETNEKYRRSFIVRQGRLLPVPEGFHLLAPSRLLPFFKSDIFSWFGKARMALDLVLPRRAPNGSGQPFTDESLAHFVRRRLGTEALERMAQPMAGGIYTADPEQLSLRATMPRFLEMERKHGSLIRALREQDKKAAPKHSGSQVAGDAASGARYSLFLSFDRGMQVLTDKLAQCISEFAADLSRGASDNESGIQLKAPVESITLVPRPADSGEQPEWRIHTGNGRTLEADAVCLALPAYSSARLIRGVHQKLASELDEISYASSVTINLAYKRDDIPHPLNGFGFVVPFIEKRSLIACTFSSVKFAGRAPQGYALLRVFAGGALQPEMFQLSEDELVRRVRGDLRDLLAIERTPLFAEVSKWKQSMPQYHVGHLERVRRIEACVAGLPRLVLAGNAYSGLGIPDCIRSGEAAADFLAALD